MNIIPEYDDTRERYASTTPALRQDIVEAALRILEEIGIAIDHTETREILHGAGATVGNDGRVRLPRDTIERALATAPEQFGVYDREGALAMVLGGNRVHFTPGSAATRILDPDTGEQRAPMTSDLIAFAELTDALPYYAAQSTALVPSDVPVEVSDSTRLAVALLHAKKPIVTGTFRAGSFAVMEDMLAIIAGNREKLREKPIAIFDCCPTSPLQLSADQAQTIIACARAGIPTEIIPAPLAGATAPVTLIGAVTQHCAEALGSVTLHQCAQPGAPVIYGGCAMGIDMRSGMPRTGATETALLQAACAEVGKHLKLPTHGYFALSDAERVNYRAGMETVMGAIIAVRAGINNIAGPGMLSRLNCQSLVKLRADHEACAMALRCAEGVPVLENPASIGDVVRKGIAQGEFLSLQHTLTWFRAESPRPSVSITPAGTPLDGKCAAEIRRRIEEETRRWG